MHNYDEGMQTNKTMCESLDKHATKNLNYTVGQMTWQGKQ